ncbi:hypothetical protein B0H16DRAFT_1745813 [Mycena metata]|uniref:HAMP domain-containing protein n=1 Tax=Mycena metata TaxID=1033252 RepID=A0AAD7MBG5_9AGAR|nr:hypothetical protein B0H16DRAFT_1745813 [Mycena metata]
MVDNLGHFATEVTRVSRDVGTEVRLTSCFLHFLRLGAILYFPWTWWAGAEQYGRLPLLLHLTAFPHPLPTPLPSPYSPLPSLYIFAFGKLGAQAHVEDVEGTWRELTDEVNTLAANLTTQVRGIAAVTSAVAKGDLSKQIDVDANEILDPKNTVNGMVLRLRKLAVEVTRVAMEVSARFVCSSIRATDMSS